MLLLFVSICALAAHLVGAAPLTVIGSEDHNRGVVQAVRLYFVEQPNKMVVAVTNAVEVIVLQNPPSTVFVRPLTEHDVLAGLIVPMGARAARRIERLNPRRWQRDVPVREINVVLGRPVNRVGRVLALNCLTRRVRIDVHDVMWIDQIYSHEPWLTLWIWFSRRALQPRNRGVGRKAIIPVAANRPINQVTKSEEIRESVFFNRVTVLEQWRVDRF